MELEKYSKEFSESARQERDDKRHIDILKTNKATRRNHNWSIVLTIIAISIALLSFLSQIFGWFQTK